MKAPLQLVVSNEPSTPPVNRSVEEVLNDLFPNVRRWVYRLLGPHRDFDDAVQDALTAIALALPRFEGRSSVNTFAYRITVRVAYRHLKRDAPLDLALVASDGPDPEAHAMDREALRRLYRALDRLPHRRRVAFVLCAIEGMSHREAAAVEGASELAMRSRLKHARKELARRLSADPYLSGLFVQEEP